MDWPAYATEVAEEAEPGADRPANQDSPSISAEIREFSTAFGNECAAIREDMARQFGRFSEGFAEMHDRMDAILAAQTKTMELLAVLISRRTHQQTLDPE